MVHAPREVVTSIMVVSVGEIVLALILVRLILIVNRGVGTLIHGPRTHHHKVMIVKQAHC